MAGLNGHLADLSAKLTNAQAELIAQGEARGRRGRAAVGPQAERQARGVRRGSGQRGGGNEG